MNKENTIKRIERSQAILSNLKHNILWKFNSTIEVSLMEIAELKELVENIESSLFKVQDVPKVSETVHCNELGKEVSISVTRENHHDKKICFHCGDYPLLKQSDGSWICEMCRATQ